MPRKLLPVHQRHMALTRCTRPGPGPHAAALGFEPVGHISEMRVAALTADNAYLYAARDAAIARVIEVQDDNRGLTQFIQSENERFVLKLRDERDLRQTEHRNLNAAVARLAGIAHARGHRLDDHHSPGRDSPHITHATQHERIRNHESTANAGEQANDTIDNRLVIRLAGTARARNQQRNRDPERNS